MAVTYYSGGSTNSWQDNGDWVADAPGQDDSAILDARYTTTLDTGVGDGEKANTGGAINCPALIHIRSGFTGDLGTSTNYLHIGDVSLGSNPLKIVHEGTGTAYIECSEDDSTSLSEIELMVINNPDATMYLKSDQNSASYISTFKKVLLIAGTLCIEDDCWVDTLIVAPTSGEEGACTVTIGTGCKRVKATADYTDIIMQTGSITSNSGANIVRMFQGTFNHGTEGGGESQTDIDIAELQMFGGTFNWYPDDADAYIGKLFVFGGTFDASSTTNATRAKVLGGGDLKDIYLFEGGSMNLKNGKGNITIAANSRFHNHGGSLTVDDYAEIAFSYGTA